VRTPRRARSATGRRTPRRSAAWPRPAEAEAQDTVLQYGQTYHINGWTVLPSSDGTTFTNDATGHGMFVSIDNVNSF